MSGFIPKSLPTVWQDSDVWLLAEGWTQQDLDDAWATFQSGFLSDVLPIDYSDQIEQIKTHQANVQGKISPVWSRWAARDNVSFRSRLDTSSSTKNQREDCLDRTSIIAEQNQGLPASLMCCDTPFRTVGWIFSEFCDEAQISFGEMMQHSARILAYASYQLALTFYFKKKADIQRPSDYDYLSDRESTVSRIPHPNHASLPSGHSTVGYATKKYLDEEFGSKVSGNIKRACEEVGLARITLGIHWPVDHQAAEFSVETFHDDVSNLL